MSCVTTGKVTVVQGKDASYTLRITDACGNSKDITGWTYIQVRHQTDDGSLDMETPLDDGTDEIQDLSYNLVPDAGSFKLKIGDYTTAALAFSALASDIETAINALPRQAGVTVSGDFTIGHTVTFGGGSGKRNQPTIEVVDSDLTNGVNPVNVTVAVTTEGSPRRGIEVVDPMYATIRVYLSEEDTALLKKGPNQSLDICVRVGSSDLNIPPLEKVLEVKSPPF